MASDVRKVIKAYPAAALIGAVVVGFAAGRMLRRNEALSMSDAGERLMTAVLKDIAGNVQELVRSEIRLAKVEAQTQVRTGTIFPTR